MIIRCQKKICHRELNEVFRIMYVNIYKCYKTPGVRLSQSNVKNNNKDNIAIYNNNIKKKYK